MWVVLKYVDEEPMRKWARQVTGEVGLQVMEKSEAEMHGAFWEVVGEFDTMEEALAMRKLLSSV